MRTIKSSRSCVPPTNHGHVYHQLIAVMRTTHQPRPCVPSSHRGHACHPPTTAMRTTHQPRPCVPPTNHGHAYHPSTTAMRTDSSKSCVPSTHRGHAYHQLTEQLKQARILSFCPLTAAALSHRDATHCKPSEVTPSYIIFTQEAFWAFFLLPSDCSTDIFRSHTTSYTSHSHKQGCTSHTDHTYTKHPGPLFFCPAIAPPTYLNHTRRHFTNSYSRLHHSH